MSRQLRQFVCGINYRSAHNSDEYIQRHDYILTQRLPSIQRSNPRIIPREMHDNPCESKVSAPTGVIHS